MLVQKELCTMAAHTQTNLEDLRDHYTSLMLSYSQFSLVREFRLVAGTCVFESLFQLVTEILSDSSSVLQPHTRAFQNL